MLLIPFETVSQGADVAPLPSWAFGLAALVALLLALTVVRMVGASRPHS